MGATAEKVPTAQRSFPQSGFSLVHGELFLNWIAPPKNNRRQVKCLFSKILAKSSFRWW